MLSEIGAGLLAAGINAGTSLLNSAGNMIYNNHQTKIQQAREDTAIQRQAADYDAAGLNRYQAGGSGAGSSRPVGENSFQGVASDMITNAMKVIETLNNAKKTEAEVQKIEADTAGSKLANAYYATDAQNRWALMNAQRAQYGAELDRIYAQAGLYRDQSGLYKQKEKQAAIENQFLPVTSQLGIAAEKEKLKKAAIENRLNSYDTGIVPQVLEMPDGSYAVSSSPVLSTSNYAQLQAAERSQAASDAFLRRKQLENYDTDKTINRATTIMNTVLKGLSTVIFGTQMLKGANAIRAGKAFVTPAKSDFGRIMLPDGSTWR